MTGYGKLMLGGTLGGLLIGAAVIVAGHHGVSLYLTIPALIVASIAVGVAISEIGYHRNWWR